MNLSETISHQLGVYSTAIFAGLLKANRLTLTSAQASEISEQTAPQIKALVSELTPDTQIAELQKRAVAIVLEAGCRVLNLKLMFTDDRPSAAN